MNWRLSARAACIVFLAGLPLRAEVPEPSAAGLAARPSPVPRPALKTQPAAPLPLSDLFGFTGPEIYKLNARAQNLMAHDMNGDGLIDLIVANNAKSRIDLLIQRSSRDGRAARAEPPEVGRSAGEINEIASDRRFESRAIPVDKEIGSLTVGDFNHDGRADVAYYGAPNELVVRYQDDNGQWSIEQRFAIPDGAGRPWALDAGDLNGDGRDDLALIGANDVYILYQEKDGKLADPMKLAHSAATPPMLKIEDLDGDGRKDLILVSMDEEQPLRVRFQDQRGQLGPEKRFELPKLRAVSFAKLPGGKATALLAIENQSGRALIYQLGKPQSLDEAPTSQIELFPFSRASASRSRDLALGDLDGDGRKDILVTDPAMAQILVYRQGSGGGIALPETFPSLAGAGTIRIVPPDGPNGKGPATVVVLSEPEKVLGISQWKDGRLTFPEPLSLPDEPVALDTTKLGGRAAIVCIGRSRGKLGERFLLHLLTRDAKGQWNGAKLGSGTTEGFDLGLSAKPEALRVFDANQDGRPDYLIFNPYGPPSLFVSDEQGTPRPVVGRSSGLISGVTPAGLFTGSAADPVMLVAQNNYARNLTLSSRGAWEALDQYNARDPGAKIAGAARLDLDGDGVPEVVLYDTTTKSLLVLKRRGRVYSQWKKLDVGGFDFKGMAVADLNGDGKPDLLVFGSDKFGVVYTGKPDRRLQPVASFESQARDAKLMDLVAGDLNSDGQLDVALTDMGQHALEIATLTPKHELVSALRFKVFEEKSFHGMSFGGMEPRESLIADVTGDGRNDLILLIHDRILVYPQDAPPAGR